MFFQPLLKSASSMLLSSLLVDPVHASYLPRATNDTQGMAGLQAVANNTRALSGFPPCDALVAANLSHAVYFPTNPHFTPLVNQYFSLNTRRAPWCFVLPSCTDEVAIVVKTLRDAGEGAGDWHIALRSGGHMSAESNNIAGGVTIDLQLLNTTNYDKETNTASYGPGPRWGSVYEELAKHDVLVNGGREADVGVAGFTLGGGVSWYAARSGFTADSVVNFEVVLASGEIVNANKSSDADLWKALKGGSSNFGIVTRFDLEAIPATNLTIETRQIAMEHQDDVIDAFSKFTDLPESFHNNALLATANYNPRDGITINVTEINTANELNTTAFDQMNKIPTTLASPKLSVDVVDSINSTALPHGTRNSGFVATIANDPRVLTKAFEVHNDLVTAMNASLGPNAFSTIMDFQPLQGYVADISEKRGGNVMGLSRDRRNKLILVMSVTLLGPDGATQLPAVAQQVAAHLQQVKVYAKSIGSGVDFTYLNYADASQNPLGGYGEESVKFIKQVAQKYDCDGFFQYRVPGGFKISRVA